MVSKYPTPAAPMTTPALFTFLKLKMTARLNTTMNIVLQSVTLFAHGVAYDKNNRHRGHIYSIEERGEQDGVSHLTNQLEVWSIEY